MGLVRPSHGGRNGTGNHLPPEDYLSIAHLDHIPFFRTPSAIQLADTAIQARSSTVIPRHSAQAFPRCPCDDILGRGIMTEYYVSAFSRRIPAAPVFSLSISTLQAQVERSKLQAKATALQASSFAKPRIPTLIDDTPHEQVRDLFYRNRCAISPFEQKSSKSSLDMLERTLESLTEPGTSFPIRSIRQLNLPRGRTDDHFYPEHAATLLDTLRLQTRTGASMIVPWQGRSLAIPVIRDKSTTHEHLVRHSSFLPESETLKVSEYSDLSFHLAP